MRYDETLVVPIIENTAFEEDLAESLELVGFIYYSFIFFLNILFR